MENIIEPMYLSHLSLKVSFKEFFLKSYKNIATQYKLVKYLPDFIGRKPIVSTNITLFKAITMPCGTNNILRNIFHIQFECEEYSTKYCQSRITLLWLWIMLWTTKSMYKQYNKVVIVKSINYGD